MKATWHTKKDKELVDRLTEGDNRAFEELFLRYYKALCNFVNLYLHDENQSKDLIQDLFLKLWEKRETLGNVKSVKGYLYTAAKNMALNQIRGAKEFCDFELLDNTLFNDEYSDNYMEYEELLNTINRLIDDLPQRCRLIFKMSREENLTYKRIASILDLSVKSVETQMGIALKRLRKGVESDLNRLLSISIFVTIYQIITDMFQGQW